MLMKPEVSAGCHQTLSLVGGVWERDWVQRDPCCVRLLLNIHKGIGYKFSLRNVVL